LVLVSVVSDKSRGRGGVRGESSPALGALGAEWSEWMDGAGEEPGGVEKAKAKVPSPLLHPLGLKAQVGSSGWRRPLLVRGSLGRAGTGGQQLEMHWQETAVVVEEHYSARRKGLLGRFCVFAFAFAFASVVDLQAKSSDGPTSVEVSGKRQRS